MMRVILTAALLLLLYSKSFSQDSGEAEGVENPNKIEHADPVFEDLTTDLGARRGENELNVNFGYQKLRKNHHVFLSQLEYEIAPLDNWGIEILFPYSVYFNNDLDETERPGNTMEFFQWGTQITFLKSKRRNISMALSFRNILAIQEPDAGKIKFRFENITYNPYLIFAKNWQESFFLLLTGGFEISQIVGENQIDLAFPINTAFHVKFLKDHFIGLELNNNFKDGEAEIFLRPQVIFQIFEDYTLGASLGIPLGIEDELWTGFLRLAYQFK
ncbi:MAG: hypothetical protein M3512_15285 [Bacteroidota bacterium]|nr:hypothetical protein [Bacteroidota bacterium]